MEISFTSKLTPIKCSDFSKFTSSFNRDNFVDFPWTISSTRVTKDVFTNNICDCSACLITDGEKAMLMHLIPTNINNHSFHSILKYIAYNFNVNKRNLQAILIGAQKTKLSKNLNNILTQVLDYLNIPTTVLKFGKAPTHIAYRTCKDEVFITNRAIDKSLKLGKNSFDALQSGFETFKLSEFDNV